MGDASGDAAEGEGKMIPPLEGEDDSTAELQSESNGPAAGIANLSSVGASVKAAARFAAGRKKRNLEPPINLEEPLCTGVFELRADALMKVVRWLCGIVLEHQGIVSHMDNSLEQLTEDIKKAQQLAETNNELVMEKIADVKHEFERRGANTPLLPGVQAGNQAIQAATQSMPLGRAYCATPSGNRTAKQRATIMAHATKFLSNTREMTMQRLASTDECDDDSDGSKEGDGDAEEERSKSNESSTGMMKRKITEKMGEVADLTGMAAAIVACSDAVEELDGRVAEVMSQKQEKKNTLTKIKKDLDINKRWQRKIEQQLEHTERTQQQKDLAQDELLQMELDAIKQAVQSRMSVADFEKAREAVLARSEENTKAYGDKLHREFGESMETIQHQAERINSANSKRLQLLDEMIAENNKLDAEREEELNKELRDIHAKLEVRTPTYDEEPKNSPDMINRLEALEKQMRKVERKTEEMNERASVSLQDASTDPLSPKDRRQKELQKMEQLQSDFAAQLKQLHGELSNLQKQFSNQIADLQSTVEKTVQEAVEARERASTRGESRGGESLGMKGAGKSGGTSMQASRVGTAKMQSRGRDGGIQSQSPDNLSWLAERMEKFANKDKEKEEKTMETLQRLLPVLEQMPEMIEKVTKLEDLAESNKNLPILEGADVMPEMGGVFSPAYSSKPATAFSKHSAGVDAMPLPPKLANLLDNNSGYSPIEGGVNVQEELERFRRLFEYLESVVPKDAQKAMQFFLGEQWRSGDKPALKSGNDIEIESRLESKIQISEDGLRREVGNLLNVVKSTQRDSLATSERLDKLERLVPTLISSLENLRRQGQAQSFPDFFVAERTAMASRERSSTASRESRRGTPNNRSSGGLLDSEPRPVGTPLQPRLSTPHPFVSQRGLGEGLESLRNDVRAWLETLRSGLLGLLKDKADSSQVHSLAAQIAAAEDELQSSSRYVQSLGALSQVYQKEAALHGEESAFLRRQHKDGPRFCASCDTPLPSTAGEWRVVTPATSHSRFPQRALPDLPRAAQSGKGLMQKTSSLPMLQGTTADRSRTAG